IATIQPLKFELNAHLINKLFSRVTLGFARREWGKTMRGQTKALIFKTNLLTGAAAIGLVAAMPAQAQDATALAPITIQGQAGAANSEATATS
ncbi:hypothetical protein, partial [Paraburkholderia sp. SIMBA_030]|uniref:hypothetical protein n=1 Tax=Paraburkholderia sp. SIMBA_030 TaxID=3085773 RepID=UPI00397A4219